MEPAAIVAAVTASGLRGRGGAAFPTGIKWNTVLKAQAAQKYIVCNADEGDSGTFADRIVMEGDPFVLIEGMTIAGIAVGATKGYIYVRSEYPHAIAILNEAIAQRRARAATSAPTCSAPAARSTSKCARAPAPTSAAKKPRCSKASKASAAWCAPSRRCRRWPACSASRPSSTTCCRWPPCRSSSTRARAFYQDYGMGRSRGTLPVQLAGNIKHGGLIELAFGVTLREILYDYGGGSASGRPIKAVQVGGPLGAYLPESQWDTPLDYEAFAALWAVLGHGGIVVHDDSADMAKLARYAMEFCAIESCGKCTPCRIGSTRGVEVIDKIRAGTERHAAGDPAARPVRHHAARLAVRDGRHDAVPGAVGAEPLPARFRPGRRRPARRLGEHT